MTIDSYSIVGKIYQMNLFSFIVCINKECSLKKEKWFECQKKERVSYPLKTKLWQVLSQG